MVYWAPLQIPFADWIMATLALAQWNLTAYTGVVDPLSPTATIGANNTWAGSGAVPWQPNEAPIGPELQRRFNLKHYVFPIVVKYSMRMMSPVSPTDFATQNCPGTPAGFN